MTVQDLLDMLEGADPQAEVRIATQPAWAMDNELTAIAHDDATGTIWLGADQAGYLPEAIADQLKGESGWGR